MTVFWIVFGVVAALLLAFDLGLHGRRRTPSAKEALVWTGVYVVVALAFCAFVHFAYANDWMGVASRPRASPPRTAALDYLTAYVIEKSLSLDNILIIALILTHFGIDQRHHHRVLFWGVLGAIVMRAVLIFLGIAMVTRFEWTTYVLGALLLLAAVRLLVSDEALDPEESRIVRLARRYLPVADGEHEGRFLVREGGQRAMTKTLLALLVVESTDLMFAVDSVPAVLSVTHDRFIAVTSNVFAILGMRALYFVLARSMRRFRYVKTSLVYLLAFVGVKMLLVHVYPIPTEVSLGVILGILGIGVGASVVVRRKERRSERS